MLKCREIGATTWKDLPTPQTYEFGIQDLDSDNAGRNQLGYMFRDRIAIKRKVSCTYSALTKAETSTVLKNTSSQFFELQFFDFKTNTTDSMVVYVGDRNMQAIRKYNSDIYTTNLTINFIER